MDVVPMMQVLQLEKVTQNLSLTLAEVITDITLTLEGIQIVFSCLARVVIDESP